MSIVFYHNPGCSKSRAVHQILSDLNLRFEAIEYLKQSFSEGQLRTLIAQLDVPSAQLVRTSNSLFKSLEIDPGQLEDDQVVEILLAHPELFQRPVVINNQQARIGRPPEKVLEIIK